jgi:hypothetical protein
MTAAVDTTLGELLSPSQVNTFLSCPAKWYFRYALGLAEAPTGNAGAGHGILFRGGGQLLAEDRNQTGHTGSGTRRVVWRSIRDGGRGCRIPRRRGTGRR